MLPMFMNLFGARMWIVIHLANDWLAATWYYNYYHFYHHHYYSLLCRSSSLLLLSIIYHHELHSYQYVELITIMYNSAFFPRC